LLKYSFRLNCSIAARKKRAEARFEL